MRLGEGAALEEAIGRIQRVFGVAYYAIARPVERSMEAICREAWEEVAPLRFELCCARETKRQRLSHIARWKSKQPIGRFLLDQLRAAGRASGCSLNDPEITCHVEITPGPLLVYARKIPGPGGLPANTAGRITCLLSGGYDSAVAAYQMMKRGRASELCSLLWHGREAWRIVAARGERPREEARAISISGQALPRAV